MVGHWAPGKTARGRLRHNPAQPIDKIPSVLIVAENSPTFDTMTHDMM